MLQNPPQQIAPQVSIPSANIIDSEDFGEMDAHYRNLWNIVEVQKSIYDDGTIKFQFRGPDLRGNSSNKGWITISKGNHSISNKIEYDIEYGFIDTLWEDPADIPEVVKFAPLYSKTVHQIIFTSPKS